MNKTIYTAVADRIEDKVTGLNWIDLDNGQLDLMEGRPPVAFPACLIDMAFPQCDDIGGTVQNVTCQVSLRVAFNFVGPTNQASPVRDEALAMFDVMGSLHAALQGWYNEDLGSFSRISAVPERRRDGLKVYRVIYQAVFEEDTEEVI